MCGICGVMSGSSGLAEQRFFNSALLLNVFRGKDSTGVFRVTKTAKQVEIAKSMSPSPVAIYDKNDPVMELINRAGSSALIGHCRAATRGEVTIDNAHPFEFSNVVGIHNGTISKKFKGSEDYKTDSEALYKLINDVGIEEALNEVESNYSTAYSLAYFDKTDGTMNFVINEERPLHFGFLYAGTTLVFSSESWVLRKSAEMQKLKLSAEEILGKDKGDVFTLNKHQLFKVNPQNVKDWSLKTLKVKPVPVTPYRGHYQGSDTDWYAGTAGGHETYRTTRNPGISNIVSMGNGTNPKLTKKEKAAMKNKSSHSYAAGFEGKSLTYAMFVNFLQCGCAMCGKTPMNDYKVRDELTWIDDDSYVCKECAEGDYKSLIEDWKAAGLNTNQNANVSVN